MPTPSASTPPSAPTEQLREAALRYAEERHWDVLPGTWLEEGDDGAVHCSCGDPVCAEPGAHPSRADWPGQASGSAVAVRRMWRNEPRASVLLPTGRTFDVIDVPEVAGCLALARMERMELPLGPVLCTPTRRLAFFVLPGAAVKVPDLLRRLGWPPYALDLTVRGEGDYVVAPPTRMTGAGCVPGCVQWARHPTEMNRWLPDAEELLSPLAYACGREAAARRGR
ncbi:bifunctional DNA primase/polymerase [Streptomyces sp. RB6PN25]|uniref:Bifunctional DNA primase/polymerase n=1 Tax=Streptomyces humicola TaxID=2953240 RepID=A0ABT1PSR5_9ACTN|nr:bifunctional DNA primase/polymerase [Streptomyces humicola]MCQ4080718.1 bifunctional DNA primase/polymerase [Streptomyces humicola]